ncbi:hypothetical protein [Marinobacter sp. MBR-105]|jgi:hypothetical protein
MMNTAVSSTIETDASIYSVTVTTDATVSTQINIAAQSPEQANQKALELVKTCGAIWALDEGSIHPKDAYLPDPESTEPLNVSSQQPEQSATRLEKTVSVILNTFDTEGNQVDTDQMDLSEAAVSDIIDHAAQLAIVMRDMGAKRCGIEAFDQVFSELESALQSAGVIAEDSHPLPALVLAKN